MERKRILTPILVLAVLGSPWLPAARSQAPPQGAGNGGDRSAAEARNRKRWEELPAEQRARLEKLYQRLSELPPDKQKLLLERMRAAEPSRRKEAIETAKREAGKDWIERDADRERRKEVESHLGKLPLEEREQLKKLTPEERRKWVQTRSEARRAEIIAKLPPHLRERLKRMPPREQIRWLERFQGERAFQQTFKDAREVARIRELNPRQAMEELRAGASATPPTRPAWISEATWSRWLELRPFERPRALRYLFAPTTPAEAPSRPAPAAPRTPATPTPPPQDR